MAVEKGPKLDWGVVANTDLTTSFKKFVKFHGTASIDAVVAVSADTQLALGVLNNAPKAGEAAEVVLSGVVKVVCGGTIARDDLIGSDATGAAVKRTPGTDATKYVFGRALESGVAGQIISVALSTATAYLAK